MEFCPGCTQGATQVPRQAEREQVQPQQLNFSTSTTLSLSLNAAWVSGCLFVWLFHNCIRVSMVMFTIGRLRILWH